MKIFARNGLAAGMVLVLLLAVVVPVAGVGVVSVSATTPVSSIISQKATVTANASAATTTIGDPVTISGMVTGSTVNEDVQIWIFAGNYVNVSTAPITSGGTYSKTYSTAGFPPALYYVFVQAPGNDGTFDLDLARSGVYSGQVVTAETGALIFNFTGTGSVQDAAASSALANALNEGGMDDGYTKTTFRLAEPASSAVTTGAPASTSIPLPAPTTRSPVLPFTVFAGIGIAGLACSAALRR
jgi:hypothetical protein